MAANREYVHILEGVKRDLLPPDIISDPDSEREKELLTQLAEEAAFVGFFSEIGLCTSNSLVAINSRLQKQSKTTISLQLGSHIGAEFEALQSNVLIDNHYKGLLPQNELDREMRFDRKHISHSKGGAVDPLWNHMVEFEKRKRKLHVFSVTANPLKYEKEPRERGEGQEEKEEEDDDDDEDDIDGDVAPIATADGDEDEDRKSDGSKRCKDATANWPLCDNCQCVARIGEKLGDVDDEREERLQ